MNKDKLELRFRTAADFFKRVQRKELSVSVLEHVFEATLSELDASPLRLVDGREHAA